jgi:hypothetical protein
VVVFRWLHVGVIVSVLRMLEACLRKKKVEWFWGRGTNVAWSVVLTVVFFLGKRGKESARER